jgi:hypothetical protein
VNTVIILYLEVQFTALLGAFALSRPVDTWDQKKVSRSPPSSSPGSVRGTAWPPADSTL